MGRTDLLLGRISQLLDPAETLVAAAALTRDEAQATVDRTARLTAAAQAPVALATEETQRVKQLLDAYEQQLRDLAPLLRHPVELSPEHLHAVGQLLDRIPVFLGAGMLRRRSKAKEEHA